MTIVRIMKKRSDTEEIVQGSIRKIERNFERLIARITCDKANDYLIELLIKTFGQKCTDIRLTLPDCPR